MTKNTALEKYIDSLVTKKTAVLGFGISNRALLRFLAENGARNVYLFDLKDSDPEAKEEAERLKSTGAIVDYKFGPGYLDALPDGGFELIFRSPIMRPDEEHIAAAVRAGAVLTSEMEVFMEHCPCPIYAITGSDGKTTTTTLTALLLRNHYKGSGVNVWLGGNIGTPLIDKLREIDPGDRVVLELSSFQLMHMDVSADASVITNITPNHLNVHKDYQEYIDCKKAVFDRPLHGGGEEKEASGRLSELNGTKKAQKRVVLNAGNEVTARIAAELASAGGSGDNNCGDSYVVDVFTAKKSPETAFELPHNGATAVFDADNNNIIFSLFCAGCGGCEGKKYELDRSDLLLPGLHNVENLMAAALLLRNEITPDDVYAVASTFRGVEHRLETVRELDGVRYINSSIDSSPERTSNALSVFPGRNLVMIAGGKDKNLDYSSIGAHIVAKVKTLILIGPTSDKIEASVRAADPSGSVRIIRVGSYKEAVGTARSSAVPGDVVLLSPASTSFDMFKNFEERGNTFKKLVMEL
ncbi:MAG: UDP-N-acetylmuramoyl-L-alanine--D-glutamate ligase [Clostridia bacterium]|nr:UDP-N-acetylmuramoyl-L-alanine--D-glutamate ligase [Clostridia bacterium]